MYFFMEDAARAVEEMGLRAVLSYGIIDLFDEARGERELKASEAFLRFVEDLDCPRITGALGPHTPYTVSRSTMTRAVEMAKERGLKVHMHLAETERELGLSQEAYGKAPVRALAEMGVLGPWLVAAHCVWLDDKDARILGEHGVSAVHNPTSNMKLAVGRAFPFAVLQASGVELALGTDGAASNNSLDMFEAMKLAGLLQKYATNDPMALRAEDALRMATKGGAAALGLKAGAVEEGLLADLILVDLHRPGMVPLFNLPANLAYAANGSVVDAVVCDGRVLMEGRRVEGEEEIVRWAAEVAHDVAAR